MARSRHALMLTTALVVVAVARASAQPVPPTPPALPDPAAILLPPVVNDSDDPAPIRPVRSDSALPNIEPAARLQLNREDYTSVRPVDYERSQRTSYSDPASARRGTDDPYGYLMGGLDERKRRSGRGWSDDDRPVGEKLGDKIDELLGGRGQGVRNDARGRFESDRAFDNFISPVTNPFLFEDPRSLTEVRPIVMFQKIPDGQSLFRGGETMFFGGQARLALGERWSIVLNKVGVSTFRPGRDARADLGRNTGLSELWLGPKVVIIRDPEFQTLVSAGATFQIPLGSSSVYQNTGKLSIVPYVSAAQKLMSTTWGTFNGMASAGYSFATNRDRSDYFYASAHLDFDVNNKHRFYPLAELNWFAYTKDGKSRDFALEGRDLANFGAESKGKNLVTWALGGRYKATSRWEFGAAFEAPLVGPRDLFRYRFTLDLIWRY